MSVTVTELANGMRVVTHEMPHLETASLGVWVGVGARFEGAGEHGISHLLEHMAFKGTARRSAREIVEEIESVGGDVNAATSLEVTAYYARVLKGDVALAVDLLADILQNPKFEPPELARETDVILQEIAASKDCPDDMAYDLVQEAAFPEQALGRTILGTADSVRGFAAADLRHYLGTHYRPGSMVLAGAGAVDHDSLVKLAEASFAAGEKAPAEKPVSARYQGGIRFGDNAFEQTHVVLAFEGPSYRDDAFYSSQILSSILGGGMSSRLFQKIREQRGLCYSIYSYCWGLMDTGLFGVHAATSEEQVSELLELVKRELAEAADRLPEEAEIIRAKAQLKAGLLMSLESSGTRAEQLARQLLVFGRPLGIDELTEKVEAVSRETVRAQAERLFGAADASMALVGPAKMDIHPDLAVAGNDAVRLGAAE